MNSTTARIAKTTVAQLTEERLLKAQAHLDDHRARVEVVNEGEDGIDATVYHDDKVYHVFLAGRNNSCTCPDFQFRNGITCKHAGIAALYLLGEAHPLIETPVLTTAPNLKLTKMRPSYAR